MQVLCYSASIAITHIGDKRDSQLAASITRVHVCNTLGNICWWIGTTIYTIHRTSCRRADQWHIARGERRSAQVSHAATPGFLVYEVLLLTLCCCSNTSCLDASLALAPVMKKYRSIVITSGTLSPLDMVCIAPVCKRCTVAIQLTTFEQLHDAVSENPQLPTSHLRSLHHVIAPTVCVPVDCHTWQ
jgi:hypothetical protein